MLPESKYLTIRCATCKPFDEKASSVIAPSFDVLGVDVLDEYGPMLCSVEPFMSLVQPVLKSLD